MNLYYNNNNYYYYLLNAEMFYNVKSYYNIIILFLHESILIT